MNNSLKETYLSSLKHSKFVRGYKTRVLYSYVGQTGVCLYLQL